MEDKNQLSRQLSRIDSSEYYHNLREYFILSEYGTRPQCWRLLALNKSHMLRDVLHEIEACSVRNQSQSRNSELAYLNIYLARNVSFLAFYILFGCTANLHKITKLRVYMHACMYSLKMWDIG